MVVENPVRAVPKPGKKAATQRAKAEKPAPAPKAAKPVEEPSPYTDTSLGTKAMRGAKDASLEIPGDRQMKMTSLPGIATNVSLLLRQNLTIEEWLEVGPSINGVRQWTSWALGDWLNFGERKFGEEYAQALTTLSYAEQTLNNFASVAHRVPMEIRRDDLSWTHHEAVARLKPEDQKKWLERARAGGWSSQVLRDVMKEEIGSGSRKPPEPTPVASSVTNIQTGEMNGAAPAVTGEVIGAPPEDDGTGAGGADPFELTPKERAAKARYEILARIVVGFKPEAVPAQDIADLLMEGPARGLYDALPAFGAYLVELHAALGESLEEERRRATQGVAGGDDEDEDEEEEDEESESEDEETETNEA